ncbi:hypothetical protein RDV84_06280 [Lysobacter yananisis]|uniref:Uncharacterized protein n=1 Tax=Lysobacter yananisis TaxID=1003114 RepID=A0ABY9PBI7_9GAMM|nr:hypothetical protein [Lysobacter yananisis]WMT04432.1 hypothetical protein RDV84_06280 [Lysobacter yananisis]
MKTQALLVPILLAAAGIASAQTGDNARRELQQAATGDSFSIGDTRFTLAPQAQVSALKTAQAADAQQVQVGKYQIRLQPSGANSASKTVAPAKQKMAAAIADTGKPVVVTSTLNVYVADASALDAAVRASGGKLTYSSKVGGNGRIEFGSVQDAMSAMRKIQALAGVKEASPAIIEEENVLY